MPQSGPWTGDPVWLADVLRAEGVKLVEFPGWRDRGHGDFKDIRGVMAHHTGSDNATAASIAYGRPDLPGPLSQLHIARDGMGPWSRSASHGMPASACIRGCPPTWATGT